MALVEHHDVVQTLAPNRTYHSLDVSVLPRRAWGRDDFRDPHRIDSLAEVLAIRGVDGRATDSAEQCPTGTLGYLAGEPSRSGMLGDGRVNDHPAIVGQNDHYIKQPKRRRCHDEHIDRSDAGGLIAQKAAPGRRRRTSSSHHVLGDCRLAGLDAELEQLAVDPGRAPERVGAAHLADQLANFAIH